MNNPFDSLGTSIVAKYPSRARAIRRVQVARLRRMSRRIDRNTKKRSMAQHLKYERLAAMMRDRKVPLHLVDITVKYGDEFIGPVAPYRCRMSFAAIADERDADVQVRYVRPRRRRGNKSGRRHVASKVTVDFNVDMLAAEAASYFGLWSLLRREAMLDDATDSVAIADSVLWNGTAGYLNLTEVQQTRLGRFLPDHLTGRRTKMVAATSGG